jgi:peptidoglycan/xylan/chitin deacetylase (PgdA/CDA1 family)
MKACKFMENSQIRHAICLFSRARSASRFATLPDTAQSCPVRSRSSFVPHCLAVFACLSPLYAGALDAQTPPAVKVGAPTGSPAPDPTASAISYSAVHVNGPYIAMTFDDGPSAKLTPGLLDILAAHHIHATFFVIGQNAAEYPEIMQRAVREGHEIGNHSWSHPAFAKMRDDRVRAELQKTDDAIKAAIGTRPVLMRPPYGSITARQKQWINAEFGYRTILWDVDPLDWKRPGAAVVESRIVRETRPGSIILSHDIHPGTIQAMPETFDQLQKKGFKFVTVSELIAMGKPMEPKQTGEPGSAPVPTPASSPAANREASPSPTPRQPNS